MLNLFGWQTCSQCHFVKPLPGNILYQGPGGCCQGLLSCPEGRGTRLGLCSAVMNEKRGDCRPFHYVNVWLFT